MCFERIVALVAVLNLVGLSACRVDFELRDPDGSFDARTDAAGDSGADAPDPDASRDTSTDASADARPDGGDGGVPTVFATSLAAGGDHACALGSDDRVYCWGDNSTGELGRPVISISDMPAPVMLGGAATSVSAGLGFSCATTATSTLCWGNNSDGQLASGTSDPRSNVPVTIAGVPGDNRGLSSGKYHTCTMAAGRAVCFGVNRNGELAAGDGSSTTATVTSDFFRGATHLSAGNGFTCAVVDGAVQCVGRNDYGQLGDGSTSASHSPVESIATGATAVAAGAASACAIQAGNVFCWGNNDSGQLGDGSRTSRSTPGPVDGLPPGEATHIALANAQVNSDREAAHTCAIAAGRAYCWGRNDRGELGDGSRTTSTTAVPVIGGPGSPDAGNVTVLALGVGFTCARMSSGRVFCWGANDFGQLGDGSRAESPTPTRVVVLP